MNEISKANISRLKDDQGFIGNIMRKEITKSERVLSSWKRKLVKYNELYKMVQNQRHYEGLARIFVPEILRAVETVVGNLEKTIFGQNPWFEYEATLPQDDGSAKALSQLTRDQMEANQFKLRTLDSFRQMAISGLTVRKILWDFNQVNQKKKVAKYTESTDPITKKTKVTKTVETITSLETVMDNWCSEPVDLLSLHISDVTIPYHSLQKATWIAEQFLVDKQWVRDKIKKEWFIEIDLDDLEETKQFSSSDAERYKLSRKQSGGYTSGENKAGYSENDRKTGIEIIERWGLVEAKYIYDAGDLKELNLDEDEMVESVIVIANRKKILKLEANPFYHNMKPYVACPYVAQEFDFSGMGVAAIGESLQEELNDTRNQTMDNKSLILMCMWLKSRTSGINNKDLTIRPMGVIPTNDVNGLVALRPPVLTGVGVNIESVIKEDLRQSVGASSNLQGIAQSGSQTATESNAVNQASYGRLALTGQQYVELILKPTLYFSESLNYQFFNTDKVIKIVGEQGIKFKNISPDDIVGQKAIIIKMGTDLDDNPGIKRQQLLQFLTIVQQMPPQVLAQHWKLLDKVYKSFFPSGHGLEDLYPAPPGEEELLQPDEEFELMRNEIPVSVKQGDDDDAHLKEHEADYEATKYAVSDKTLQLEHSHILEHMQAKTNKFKAQQQAQAQAAAASQGGSKGGQGSVNMGQIPNASPFTQASATKGSDLNRNMGGMGG